MSNVVNIVELQNVVTNVTGVGNVAQLQADVINLQKMVNFAQKTIYTNIISRYDQSPIQVKDPISFLSSIQVAGNITLNGSVFSGGGGGISTITLGTGSIMLKNPADSTNIYYSNVLRIPNQSTVAIAGDLIPDSTLSYDLGSTSSYWRSLYVGTGTIFLGPTGTIGYSNDAVTIGPAVRTNRLDITNGQTGIGLYTDGAGLVIQLPDGTINTWGGSGVVGSTGPTGTVGPAGATGPTGAVLYTAVVFDGGNAFSSYEENGPAFDCGGAT